MSRQKAQIKTPVHSGGAFSRNENSSLCHFTPRKKIALQLAVSLWIAGGLLGAPGIAAAQDIVTVVDHYVNDDVFGNHDLTGWGTLTEDPNNNTVTVNAGVTVSGGVIGSQYRDTAPYDDNVTNNTVILKGTAGRVYGGYSYNGATSKNKVTISGGTANGYVIGGWSVNNTADENTVEISDGTINNSVYGGESDKATAAKNTVTISGGTIKYSVYGGQGYTGVTGNTVEISGGTIENSVYGGSANDANSDAPAASVTDNSVKIFQTDTTTPTIKEKVYGGYSEKGVANNNTVEISGGTIGTDITDNVYGGRGKTSASENKVTISGGTINSSVYGGSANDANSDAPAASATGNTVKIFKTDTTTPTIKREVYGGYSEKGVANNNTVEISGGTIGTYDTDNVYGGFGETSASENKVTISGGTLTGQVYGGYSLSGVANKNTVEISDGTINSSVIGAFAGTATGNTVEISGGTIEGLVYAGNGYMSAMGNSVKIFKKDTTTPIIKKEVYGGYSENGAANKNTIEISGGTIGTGDTNNVYGGFGKTSASENTVTISGGTLTGQVYGGYSLSGVANKNTVEISDGTINSSVNGGYVDGFDADATATGNTVTISGGTIWGDVNGGFASIATGNTVEISDGTIVYSINGGLAKNGAASGNTITITGGTMENGVVCGGYTGNGVASGNTVTITGGVVSDVYGGSADNGAANSNTVEISGGTIHLIWGGCSGTAANGNTVTISGDAKLDENAYIAGGVADTSLPNSTANNNTVNILTQIAVQQLSGGSAATSSGNTLNLAAKGVTATDVGYFQNLNFYLPTDMTKNDTMLTVNDTAYVDGATVGVLAQGTLTNLKDGDTITLLKANTLSGTISNSNNLNGTIATAIIPTGITTVDTYTFGIKQDNNANAITATLGGISTSGGGDNNSNDDINNTPGEGNNNSNNNTPAGGDNNSDSVTNELQANTKSMVETRAASTTILNAGADMLAGQGFQQAANAIAQAAESGDGQGTAGSMTPFAAIGTGSLRAESGSYVDAKSWAINVGFAKEINNRQGKLLFGPLVEYGRGSYDSYLDNGTHGEGNSSYWGLGLMARQTNHDGLYYEGSLRGGKVKADYSGNVNTLNVNYDSSSNYIAAHLGLGKVSKISADDQLDCYVKYFYSRQSGDNVTMHAAGVPDEVYNFDSVSSHRLRLGTRLTHKLNKQSSLYGGVAYQYEFDGDARATYNGNSTPSPSVKGGSGMFELGWQVKPDASPLTLDLGLTAWAGKQRGLTGQLGINWKF